MADIYGHDRQKLEFPVEDWQHDVANGYTILGYQEWLTHKIESKKDDDNRAEGSE